MIRSPSQPMIHDIFQQNVFSMQQISLLHYMHSLLSVHLFRKYVVDIILFYFTVVWIKIFAVIFQGFIYSVLHLLDSSGSSSLQTLPPPSPTPRSKISGIGSSISSKTPTSKTKGSSPRRSNSATTLLQQVSFFSNSFV